MEPKTYLLTVHFKNGTAQTYVCPEQVYRDALAILNGYTFGGAHVLCDNNNRVYERAIPFPFPEQKRVEWVPVSNVEYFETDYETYEARHEPATHPLAGLAGAFKDDPFFDAVMENIETQRLPWWRRWLKLATTR